MRRSIAWLLAVFCVGLLPSSAGAASGEAQWTRVDKTYARSEGADVAVYESDVYMAGDGEVNPCVDTFPEGEGGLVCSGVAFLRRYTASGTVVWARSFNVAAPAPPGASSWVRRTTVASIAVDASGVYMTGTAFGQNPFDACGRSGPGGVHEAFVRKHTLSGAHVWTRRFAAEPVASSEPDCSGPFIGGTGIAIDGTGLYVAGNTTGSLPGYQNPGGDADFGRLQGYDVFLRKYTRDGALVWTRQETAYSDDTARDVALDPWGVYVAGRTYGGGDGGSSDAFVHKYTRSGGLIWTHEFTSVAEWSPDSATSIATDGANFYVGGYTYGTFPGQVSKGDYDGWVRKYRGDGTVLWTRQFGTSGDDNVYGLDADSSGVFLTGSTSAALAGYTSRGGHDAYVTSYSGTGARGWTRQFGSSYRDIGRGIAIGPPPGDTQQDSRQGVYVTGEWGAHRTDYDYGSYAFLRKHER